MEATHTEWRKKHFENEEAWNKRVQELEEENARLKAQQ